MHRGARFAFLSAVSASVALFKIIDVSAFWFLDALMVLSHFQNRRGYSLDFCGVALRAGVVDSLSASEAWEVEFCFFLETWLRYRRTDKAAGASTHGVFLWMLRDA